MEKYYLNYFWIDIEEEERDFSGVPPNLNQRVSHWFEKKIKVVQRRWWSILAGLTGAKWGFRLIRGIGADLLVEKTQKAKIEGEKESLSPTLEVWWMWLPIQ